MAPTEFDEQELVHHIAQARKLLAKLDLPLPENAVYRAILMGEMQARLQLLADAAEPFAQGGGGRVDG